MENKLENIQKTKNKNYDVVVPLCMHLLVTNKVYLSKFQLIWISWFHPILTIKVQKNYIFS